MNPPNLESEILNIPYISSPDNHITELFPWSSNTNQYIRFQKSPAYEKAKIQSKCNFGMNKMISDEDLTFVTNELKKLDLYDPGMKSTIKFLKLSIMIIIAFVVLFIGVFAALVIPEEMKMMNFLVYGFCSIFFIAMVISILSCIFFKLDCDKMLNREIQIRDKLNQINVDNFIARGIVWKVTKLGAFLKAKLIHQNHYSPEVKIVKELDKNGNLQLYDRVQGRIYSKKENKDGIPTLADVYDDEHPIYFQCVSKNPFSGPVSSFNPNERRKQGLYTILKKEKNIKN